METIRTLTIRAVVVLLIILALPLDARAGISAPNSTVIRSKDGGRILVLLSSYAAGDRTPTTTLSDGRVVSVHTVFPATGVYDAVTLQPIWTADWFALSRDILASDDLRYIVRRNRFGFDRQWALAFYDQGKLTRQYSCNDLLTGLRYRRALPLSDRDWHTRWYGEFNLDADYNQLRLSTARREAWLGGHRFDLGLQEFYTFDLPSGRITSIDVRGRWVIWAYGVGLLLFCVSLYQIPKAIIRRIHAHRQKSRRGFPL